MNLKDVVNFIITDASVNDGGMDAIITAVRERQKLKRAVERTVAQATLREGMAVELSGLRPKYWNGTKGVITGFNKTRTRANIRVTESSDVFRIKVGEVRNGFPLTTLTAIGTAPATSAITDADADALIEFMGG